MGVGVWGFVVGGWGLRVRWGGGVEGRGLKVYLIFTEDALRRVPDEIRAGIRTRPVLEHLALFWALPVSICQHLSAFVSICQHHVQRQAAVCEPTVEGRNADTNKVSGHVPSSSISHQFERCRSSFVSICQHLSAIISNCQHCVLQRSARTSRRCPDKPRPRASRTGSGGTQ